MKNFFLIIFLAFFSLEATAKSQTNVILKVSKAEQQDTLGYNVVEFLPKKIYQAIQEGKITIWDSPKKAFVLQPSTLKDIEKSAGLNMSDIDNFFVYEYWKMEKDKVMPEIAGIYFATRNKKGEEVNFGFVEYKDIFPALDNSDVPVNIDGFLGMSLKEIMLSNRYNYSLLQYGSKTVTNTAYSEKLKSDLFRKKRWGITYPIITQSKKVEYAVSRNNGILKNSAEVSNRMLDSIEAYFNDNMEEFYNYGGDKLESFISTSSIKVSKIEVQENWEKIGGSVLYNPMTITIYFGKPLNPILVNELKITLDGKSLRNFLIAKTFDYTLLRINDREVDPLKNEVYREALLKGEWNKITAYTHEH